MTFRPWEEVRDEINAKHGITQEELDAALREVEAYYAGYQLAELRKKRGVTQVELAERMGIGQPRVSAIERGEVESLTMASVLSYVEALGGSVRLIAHFDDNDGDAEVMVKVSGSAA